LRRPWPGLRAGDLERPLAGVVARLYDVLMTGEEFSEDRD
jgi:hypothetical protein